MIKLSRFLFKTFKHSKESSVVSDSLLQQSGFIKQISSGLYQLSPLMQIVVLKVSNIIREELNKIGSSEVDLSQLQPTSIWNISGRLEGYKKEELLFVLNDRNNSEFCMSPTAEEASVCLIKDWISSYKELPISIYQINYKFRDEIRPKNGLLRCKSFLMKDAYSFTDSEESSLLQYNNFKNAYSNIFNRVGIKFAIVKADSGQIGGDFSEEFQALTESGGDDIIIDEEGNAFNIEVAKSEKSKVIKSNLCSGEINTPGIKTIRDLVEYLKIDSMSTIKTLAYVSPELPGKIILALIPGSRMLSDFKLFKSLNIINGSIASKDDLLKFGIIPGYIGPIELDNCIIVADESLKGSKNIIVGANKKDCHIVLDDLNSFKNIKYDDIDLSTVGDISLSGKKFIKISKSLEIGHVFILGSKYAEKMDALFTDKDGSLKPFNMGCYGIGITRLIAAFIEQNHDEKGMIFSKSIAPFEVNVIAFQDVMEKALDIYEELIDSGIDAAIDDREKGFGAKVKDSDLIGIPYKIIVGKKSIETGNIELESRLGNKEFFPTVKDLIDYIKKA